jgi:hypothetical protein
MIGRFPKREKAQIKKKARLEQASKTHKNTISIVKSRNTRIETNPKARI